MRSPVHARLCGRLLAATLIVAPLLAPAEETRTPQSVKQTTISIAPQPLASALQSFSEQSGLQVGFASAVAKGIRSPGARDAKTAAEALDALLAGTGLEYQFVNQQTVIIKARGTPKVGSIEGGNFIPLSEQLRLAEAQPVRSSDDEVEEMLVEGERDKPAPFSTANLDLTRTEDDVLPFTVFTERDIQLSGASSLQEFLQNRLPQNFNADIPAEMSGQGLNPGMRANRVAMRGWSAAETVFLLDGRRMSLEYSETSTDDDNATPNLNQIPLGSIERVEILTSAGSAIYGESATGGVINIITRRDYRGGQLWMNYETPADVNRPQRAVNFSVGAPLALGIGLRLNAGYRDGESPRLGDRADVTLERLRRLTMERDPGQITGQYGAPFGATPNIQSRLSEPLFGPDSPTFTSVPVGYVGGGGIGAFSQRQGVYNLDLPEAGTGASFDRSQPFGVTPRDVNVALGLDRSFGDRWRLSVDYGATTTKETGLHDSGMLQFLLDPGSGDEPFVPAATPGNPFNQDLFISLVDPRLQRPELGNRSTSRSHRMSAVLRGEVGKWRGYVDATHTRLSRSMTSNTYVEPTGGWEQAFLNGDYNPFVDVSTTPPAAPEFYENYALRNQDARGASTSYLVGTRISGPLFVLPAGPLELTLGADWSKTSRSESYYIIQFQDSITRAPVIPTSYSDSVLDEDNNPGRRFDFANYSFYAEANVPVFGANHRAPLLHGLEVFASGYLANSQRRSESSPARYNPKPHVYAFGLRYEPAPDMALRFSRSLGFKPASISFFTPSAPYPLDYPVYDPVRRQVTFVPAGQVREGGNPDIRPESTLSTNVGVILTPRALPGLRLSLDYVESLRDDAIIQLTAYQVVQGEALFPERLERGPPDGHVSGVGRIVSINAVATNFNLVASKSFDFSLEQRLGNFLGGDWSLALRGSENLSFKVQTSADQPPMEQVRDPYALFFAQSIKWNGNAQLHWQGARWALGWSTRYLDWFPVAEYAVAVQGSDRVKAAFTHDFVANYSVPAGQNGAGWRRLLSGSSITFGIKDVFNRTPRLYAVDTERGIAGADSIMRRTVWLSARREF